MSSSLLNFSTGAGFGGFVLVVFLGLEFISGGFSQSVNLLGSFTGFSFVDQVSDDIENSGSFVISKDKLLFGMNLLFKSGKSVSSFGDISITGLLNSFIESSVLLFQ
jgi:hypothetical protein